MTSSFIAEPSQTPSLLAPAPGPLDKAAKLSLIRVTSFPATQGTSKLKGKLIMG
jgi:hypothetical protein